MVKKFVNHSMEEYNNRWEYILQRDLNNSSDSEVDKVTRNNQETQEVLNAGIAQLVERNLAKVEVEGSNPFSRSKE